MLGKVNFLCPEKVVKNYYCFHDSTFHDAFFCFQHNARSFFSTLSEMALGSDCDTGKASHKSVSTASVRSLPLFLL